MPKDAEEAKGKHSPAAHARVEVAKRLQGVERWFDGAALEAPKLSEAPEGCKETVSAEAAEARARVLVMDTERPSSCRLSCVISSARSCSRLPIQREPPRRRGRAKNLARRGAGSCRRKGPVQDPRNQVCKDSTADEAKEIKEGKEWQVGLAAMQRAPEAPQVSTHALLKEPKSFPKKRNPRHVFEPTNGRTHIVSVLSLPMFSCGRKDFAFLVMRVLLLSTADLLVQLVGTTICVRSSGFACWPPPSEGRTKTQQQLPANDAPIEFTVPTTCRPVKTVSARQSNPVTDSQCPKCDLGKLLKLPP